MGPAPCIPTVSITLTRCVGHWGLKNLQINEVWRGVGFLAVILIRTAQPAARAHKYFAARLLHVSVDLSLDSLASGSRLQRNACRRARLRERVGAEMPVPVQARNNPRRNAMPVPGPRPWVRYSAPPLVAAPREAEAKHIADLTLEIVRLQAQLSSQSTELKRSSSECHELRRRFREASLGWLFNCFDLDSDGSISTEELYCMCDSLEPGRWTAEASKEMHQILDANRNGLVSANEFVSWYLCESSHITDTDFEDATSKLISTATSARHRLYLGRGDKGGQQREESSTDVVPNQTST